MTRTMRLSTLLAAALAAAPAASARPAERVLTRDDAVKRAAAIRGLEYDLALELDGEKPDFKGRVALRFELEAPADGLTIDFADGKVARLSVNGKKTPADYNGLFITLPKALLRAGHNAVVVDYSHPYSADGAGLYRFKDPEDGRVYMYTNFEPYDANKLFPCFDQPDLKAAYVLRVTAPADWTVVSTVKEAKTALSGARRTWTFAKTPKLSTYVFSVHAGPFHVWSSTSGRVPARLFARQSLAKYIPAEEWLELTRQGLDFFDGYFDVPYPFGKYDQLVVPDFNAGAMENAGAVTFSERYVFRSTPTLEDREAMANTLLHEMAHMWFGDLVTMRWWNGLWLNESFATYMASLAVGKATRFTRSWQTFFSDDKQWGYAVDQRDTTHPIEGPVPDTGQAFANFDGITYGKGASVLKQLAYLLGPDRFRDGVRLYLKTHAYGNAEESDFFAALSKAAGAELGVWTRDWLKTAGVNTLRAEYACADGKVSSFALLQSAEPAFPTLRRHRTVVALYGEAAGGGLAVRDEAAVGYEGSRTEVPALVGRPCPALVYPNHGDEDYAKVELDALSLAAVKKGLTRVPDALARAMLWHTLWEMVRDAKLPVSDYLDLVVADLGKETDFKVVLDVLETIQARRGTTASVLNYLPDPDYPRLEAFLWERLAASEPGGDFQKLWFDVYAKNAASADGAAKLRALLTGTAELAGMTVDQDRRWTLLARLGELGAADAEALVLAELQRDPSDLGAKSALTARAARADGKRAWFDRLSDPKSADTLGEQRAIIARFFPPAQKALRGEFLGPFLETLPALLAAKGDDFLDDYTRAMIPTTCSKQSVAALEGFLAKTPPANPVVLRALRDARQEDARCVKVRALLR
ncbi:MAG: aminopeptidase N [Elusimicrobia bacterium]|nr:aminopeptidase N [Elusimicrobiota bacterium]